jgi:hypothetical protein
MNFETGVIHPAHEEAGVDEELFQPTEFDLEAVETAFTTRKTASMNSSPPSQTSSSGTFDQLNTVGIESEFPNKRKVRANVRETGTDSMKNYISKSMCSHELLNKNEEIILAREIQILVKWEAQREKLEEQLLRLVYL